MSKWGDFVARAAVRRVVYIIVGLIVTAAISWSTPARAQTMTQAQAVSQCRAWIAAQDRGPNGIDPATACYLGVDVGQCMVAAGTSYAGRYTTFGPYDCATQCPNDKPYDPVTGGCGNECANKAPMTGVATKGDTGGFCSGGCAYSVDLESPMRTMGAGAERRTFGTFRASGSQCTVDDPIDSYDPNRSICNTVASNNDGSVSQCVRPDGNTCVSMGGARLCYAPGETGDRMTTDGKLATNRVNEGETPKAPANQQNPQQIATTTTTVNNNTTVTSVFSGSGTSPGQSNVGPGGSNGGGGSGSGDGTGNGDGDGEGEDDGPGGIGSELTVLFESDGRTVADAFNQFKASAMQTPLIGASASFFSAPSGGGSCPVWTVPATDWNPALTFDYLCTGALAALLALAGYVIMAVAAMHAWHIFAGN